MKYLIILIAVLLTACDNGRVISKDVYECNDKAGEFIISCAKAANPLSDEEGEDLVAQCERTSKNLYCKHTVIPVLIKGGECFLLGDTQTMTSCY